VATTTNLIATTGDVTLDRANDFKGTVSVNSTGDTTLVNGGGLDLGNVTLTGNLTVTVGGDVTDSGTLLVGGTTTIDAGTNDIALDTPGNDLGGAVNLTGDDVTLVDIDDIDLGDTDVGGNLSVTADSNITDSLTLMVDGATALSGLAITLDSPTNEFTGIVAITSADSTTLVDMNDLQLEAAELAATLTLFVNGSVTQSGPFSGVGGITFEGPGTLILSHDNTYTGPTVVNDGMLRIDGSTAHASDIFVNSGVTLRGNGTVNGGIQVASGGTIDPGLTTGILNTHDVSYAAGSTFSVQIDDLGAGSGYDQINVSGEVSLDGANLDLDILSSLTPPDGLLVLYLIN